MRVLWRNLSGLHKGEKDFIFKSLSIFTNAPAIIMKHSKETDPSNIFHLLSLFMAETRNWHSPASSFKIPLETAIDVATLTQTTDTGYMQQLTCSDQDSLLSVLTCACGRWSPETADSSAQRNDMAWLSGLQFFAIWFDFMEWMEDPLRICIWKEDSFSWSVIWNRVECDLLGSRLICFIVHRNL